jgi:hypothetical protein
MQVMADGVVVVGRDDHPQIGRDLERAVHGVWEG